MSRASRAVVGVVLAVGLAAATTGGRAHGAPDWQSFRHPSQGFSISYPRGWETLSGTGQASFVAIGPTVAGAPGTRMVVVVVAAPLPRGATLEDAESSIQANLSRSGQPTNVLRHDRFSLRGTPAFLIYLHRKNPQGVELYQMVMVLMHRGRGFGVAGSTAAASSSLTEDTRLLQSILLTFRPLR
ncbi:MAG: hypothetical protein ACRDIC_04280 [bacterium]